VQVPDERFRAPHILSLGFSGNLPAGLMARLASQQIYVASRLGRMRISPHVYNDEADIDRFVAAMQPGR
jgi:selenocysteine lyase/cysteine desulfurase